MLSIEWLLDVFFMRMERMILVSPFPFEVFADHVTADEAETYWYSLDYEKPQEEHAPAILQACLPWRFFVHLLLFYTAAATSFGLGLDEYTRVYKQSDYFYVLSRSCHIIICRYVYCQNYY